MIAVEKQLSTLPHLSAVPKNKIPKRRADIICFASKIHPHFSLYPLLLVECKVDPIRQAHFQQIIGYNEIVGAPFLAVVNAKQIYSGFYNQFEKKYTFQAGLSSYTDLIKAIRA